MSLFNLPARTAFNKVVPKNAFDDYTNTKQKQAFVDGVQRITWAHKLSSETINLKSNDVKEIEIFKVELKQKQMIPKILEVIDKSIPYHIIFWVEYGQEVYLSTSAKHPHPTNPDMAVIDWVFTTSWIAKDHIPYHLHLNESLDAAFKDFCLQLCERPDLQDKPMEVILSNQKELDRLQKELAKVQSTIQRTKQFNKRVELNQRKKLLEDKLKALKS